MTTPQPAPLSIEVEDRLLPGAILEMWPGLDDDNNREPAVKDARRARLLSLRVSEQETVSPFMPRGPFVAKWRANLYSELGDVIDFSLRGHGTAKLVVNGTDVLRVEGDLSQCEPRRVQLRGGFNEITLTYRSLPAGASSVNLLWAGEGFGWEPLPPDAIFHDPSDELLVEQTTLRQGRELIATRGCVKCHACSSADGTHGMPELGRDFPDLREAGGRLRPAWMLQWLLEPLDVRNDTMMPAINRGTSDESRRRRAADVVAYLSSLARPANQAAEETGESDHEELVADGETLFVERGCLACHRFTPPDDEEDYFDRISLHFTAAKYQPGALAEFIFSPCRRDAWSRMPDMQLNDQEATALAAYIRENSEGTFGGTEVPAGGDPAEGEKAYYAVGCGNCHKLADQSRSTLAAPSLASVDTARGCLAHSPEARGAAPDYQFTEEERSALGSFLDSSLLASLGRKVPLEVSQRYFRALRCRACHGRDGEPNLLGDVVYEETGKPPEDVPHLTWTGEKLHGAWMHDMFAGKLPYRARPWMKLRMPVFPSRAKDLSAGLIAEHGADAQPPEADRPDADSIAIGRQLTLQAPQGFFCIQCHAVADRPPAGSFDHRGVNFALVRERIRRAYYTRWITAPTRLDPGSKMPTFSPDGKASTITSIYEGDAQKQFAAIWDYLQSLGATTSP